MQSSGIESGSFFPLNIPIFPWNPNESRQYNLAAEKCLNPKPKLPPPLSDILRYVQAKDDENIDNKRYGANITVSIPPEYSAGARIAQKLWNQAHPKPQGAQEPDDVMYKGQSPMGSLSEDGNNINLTLRSSPSNPVPNAEEFLFFIPKVPQTVNVAPGNPVAT